MNTRLTIKTILLSTLLLPSAWGASTMSFGELPSVSWKKLQRYVSPQLIYTNDYLSNTGGAKAGPRNIGALEIFLDSDLSKYSDVQGELLVHYVHLDSSDERASVGDAQTASNIDAGARVDRLTDLWYQHNWSEDFKTLAGIHDISSEFNMTETSLMFLNSSFGTTAELSYSGANGPSLYPFTSAGVRALYNFGRNFSVRTGLYDSDPGDEGTYRSFHSDIGGNEGYLHISEVNYEQKNQRFGLGGWNHTRGGSFGTYALYERAFNHSAAAFARYGWANPEVSTVQSTAAMGFVYKGIIQHKKNMDEAGVGASRVHFSRAADASEDETAYELYYQFRPLEIVSFRPDVQFIKSPSGDENIKDAWVMGLRTVVELN